MKTINEQIIDNYEDLVSKLADTLTVLKTCVSTKRVTEKDENKLSSLSEQIDVICGDISKLKAQAEQEKVTDEELKIELKKFNDWMCDNQFDGRIPMIDQCIQEYMEYRSANK